VPLQIELPDRAGDDGDKGAPIDPPDFGEEKPEENSDNVAAFAGSSPCCSIAPLRGKHLFKRNQSVKQSFPSRHANEHLS
jgi:hypothetical protein